MSSSTQIVKKLRNGNILRDDGLSYGDYVKMPDERAKMPSFTPPSPLGRGSRQDGATRCLRQGAVADAFWTSCPASAVGHHGRS
jgi:hypothetical protein